MSVFLVVGMILASSLWKSLKKLFQSENGKGVWRGRPYHLQMAGQVSSSHCKKATLSTGHRTAVSCGVQLNPRRSHRNAKRSLSSRPLLNIHFHTDSPPPTSCRCSVLTRSASFLSWNITFKRKTRFGLEQQISDNWDLTSEPKARSPTFVFLQKVVTSSCGATEATPSPSARRAVKCYGCTISLLITQKSRVDSKPRLRCESIQWAISAAALLLNPLCHDRWLWLYFFFPRTQAIKNFT